MKSQQDLNNIKIKIRDIILQCRPELLLLFCACSFIYIVFSLISVDVLFSIIICISSLMGYVLIKWRTLRQKGILNKLSSQKKLLLTQKSILDIYRDLVYFPKVTKIVGAFLKGAISKPHPDKIHQSFDELPQSIINTINTKGILHLAPQKVEKLLLTPDNNRLKQNEFKLPDNYGKVDFSWYNRDKYHAEQTKIHEYTPGKTVANAINEKVKWKHLIGLCMIVAYGLYKTKGKKMSKIITYNGSLLGILLVVIMLLIKTSKPLKKYKIRN